MFALALVALFIFWGKTPSEISDKKKIHESAHPKANKTQELMLQCLNENPKERPAAAVLCLTLENFGAPSPDRPSGDLFQVYFFTFFIYVPAYRFFFLGCTLIKHKPQSILI
jgi:hypothetical protein